MPGRNPWVVLCVAEDAPFHEVQRAFRQRVKQTHPDGGGDASEFAAVVRAFALVRQSSPPRSRRSSPRPTPYDGWLRPCGPTASWTDNGLSATAASGMAAAPWTTATVAVEPSEFSSVLHTEMSKAMASATGT
jgi:hypothetical protein